MGRREEAAGLGTRSVRAISGVAVGWDKLALERRPTLCDVDWHEMVGLRLKRLVPPYVMKTLTNRTSASGGRESPVPVRRDRTIRSGRDASVEQHGGLTSAARCQSAGWPTGPLR